MSGETELFTLTDLVYEAVLDSDLWPSVLLRLADAAGAAQIAMPSFDQRANVFATIAPRFDPDLLVSYREYWAFNEPMLPRAVLRPLGQIYSVDDLMPREEFAATPVFNEWWRQAGCGLAAMGANLVAEDQFSALICLFNAPGKDTIASEQVRLFEAMLPRIMRAVRISRQLLDLELKHVAAVERLEMMQQGALLVDASARVVVANSTAKAMLDSRDGIFLCNGRLAVAGSPDELQNLVVSCAPGSHAIGGPREINVPRELPRSPLHVAVIPLLPYARLPDFPWVGFGSPVAIVTVTDRDLDRRRQQVNLHRRFGLTSAEALFATEILKGDGRKAAAQRCAISDGTAKTYLANIFEKTGTHRQAELIRLLVGVAGTQEMEP
jgi:DNA-binding CsgD family transcriptional regulator